MSEPEILKKGKEFHRKVQEDWKRSAKNGRITLEHTVTLVPPGAHHKRHGRLDLFVDKTSDFVTVIEIKSTNWDLIHPKNRKNLLGAHRRQIWNYIEHYIDNEHLDVCPGIIYKNTPKTPGLKDEIEEYLNEWLLQVVWYED